MGRLSRMAVGIGMLAALVGCDREVGDIGGVAKATSAPAALQDVVIRVFLWEGPEMSVAVRSGELHIKPGQAGGTADVSASSGRLSRRDGKWYWAEGRQGAAQEIVTQDALVIRPVRSATLEAGAVQLAGYRGTLRCIPSGDQKFVVVNEVDMESYLAGVVGAEMFAYWNDKALKAQAIACRTYALYQMHQRRSEGGAWDVRNDQGSQVYGGVASEDERVAQAVEATRGIVLTYGPAGKEKLFPAYFSSSCGGHTQNAASVFGHRLVPLSGSACPYCKDVAKPEHYRWAPVDVSKAEVSRRLLERYPELAKLETITDVQVARRSDYGRVEAMRLIGSNGRSRLICGEDFRLGVTRPEQNIRSSWYEMKDNGDSWRFEDGHGWGHGVGMCQCGAQEMARQGRNAVEILLHYYPESTLVRAY